MRLAALMTLVATAWVLLAACDHDAQVLYPLSSGGEAGSDAAGGSAATGEPMKVSCEPMGVASPCYCPKQSSCHCGASETLSCSVDCPEGLCDVECDGDCDLWCTNECTFACPANANCYVKCSGDCEVTCGQNATCKITSYVSTSTVSCLEGATCTCLKGSLCDCEGAGCLTEG